MPKPPKPYGLPKSKVRVPKPKATAGKRMLSSMKNRLKVNPYSKKGK